MKFILVPDSFKGTVSAKDVAKIERKAILNVIPDACVRSIPAADGGEGTAEALVEATGGEMVRLKVCGPYMEETAGFYGIINNGKTAVVEMAAAAGLPMVGENKNPLLTTTYGVGELMDDAIKKGVSEIILALGGSATNDGGCGAAAALGAEFVDKNGKTFIPKGGTLSDIGEIKTEKLKRRLSGVSVTVMCDIDNPLFGAEGAAYVFAPQKGADENQVKLLDDGLRAFADAVKKSIGADIADIPGAGAAGGFGGGAVAFFDGKIVSGIDAVLNVVSFEKELPDTDFIITGEGKTDGQSIRGKVVSGVARRAKNYGVPVIVISGAIDDEACGLYDLGVTAMFSINRKAEDFSVSKLKSEENLYKTTENIIRLIKHGNN